VGWLSLLGAEAGGMVTLSDNLMKGKTYSFMVTGIG